MKRGKRTTFGGKVMSAKRKKEWSTGIRKWFKFQSFHSLLLHYRDAEGQLINVLLLLTKIFNFGCFYMWYLEWIIFLRIVKCFYRIFMLSFWKYNLNILEPHLTNIIIIYNFLHLLQACYNLSHYFKKWFKVKM
jgi:hypothetical protein